VWGAWHLLTNVLWPATVLAQGLPVETYTVLSGISILTGQLPVFRVLMVWLYDRGVGMWLVVGIVTIWTRGALIDRRPVTQC
jgi:hypothetical protein